MKKVVVFTTAKEWAVTRPLAVPYLIVDYGYQFIYRDKEMKQEIVRKTETKSGLVGNW